MKRETKVTLLIIPICIIIGFLIRVTGTIGVIAFTFAALNSLVDFVIWIANRLVDNFE
jgi:hypothetical protein